MAGPVFDRKLNTKFLSEGFEALGLDDANRTLEKIDDYFENTSSRTRAFHEAGKNLQANQELISPMLKSPELPPLTHTWPMYVVEFKAGRTDYFYLPEESKHLKISVGDLAIVEADRGKDLGKVIECSINSITELQMYQATHQDPLVDSHNAVGKDIHPKRIFRIAAPNEVAMLLQKGQDEAKANGLCQIKIRQKKLPMEIVDAEYQWDRRKLTFYFVADRRIDFRELVRELFKIYKTRIWMVYLVLILVCCATKGD
jgi:PSP1 C-terminal conserved region